MTIIALLLMLLFREAHSPPPKLHPWDTFSNFTIVKVVARLFDQGLQNYTRLDWLVKLDTTIYGSKRGTSGYCSMKSVVYS